MVHQLFGDARVAPRGKGQQACFGFGGEAQAGDELLHAGGVELPRPVRLAMRMAARVMTGTAHYI